MLRRFFRAIAGRRRPPPTPVDASAASLDRLTDLLARFEGFRSKAYLCPNRVWTYGYGSTWRPDGKSRVRKGDRITKAEARDLLRDTAASCRAVATGLLPDADDPEYPNACRRTTGAVIGVASLVFNFGPSAVAKSRFLKAWRRGDLDAAEFEFLDFNKITKGNRKVPSRGLTRRRKAEWKIITENSK